jgi:aspartyl-tRNA(Asn)/glutamyl-tRNA(Gln) amidotransferase subunit A
MYKTSARWPEFRSCRGEPVDLSLCGEVAQKSFDAGRSMKADALFEVMDSVKSLVLELETCFAHCDFILTPATAALPWSVGQDHPGEIDSQPVGPRGHAVFTAFANAAGLPGVALPTDWVGGIPTGMQLIGRRGADAALLALSRQFEAAHPWCQNWPPESLLKEMPL